MRRTRIMLMGELWIGSATEPRPEDNEAASLAWREKLLLAALAVTTAPVPRIDLIRRLWPEAVAKGTGDANLNNGVSHARGCLCSPDVVYADRKVSGLLIRREGKDKQSDEPFVVEIDFDEFKQHLDAGTSTDINRALNLVRGRFLDGMSHAWLDDERRRIDLLIVKAIRTLTHWPNDRAVKALQDFYAQPTGTLAGYVTDLQAADLDDAVLPGSEPDTALLASLEALYPGDPKLETLRTLITPQRPVYRNMSVRFSLHDGHDPSTYTLKYQIEYFAYLDEFVVALTTRATLGDLLIAECPRISDAFAFSTEAARRAFPKSGINLVHYEALPDGRTSKRDCEFRQVQSHHRKPYLGAIAPDLAKEVMLYRALVPGVPGRERHLELTIASEHMLRSEHYCFWIADRPSFVRRITMDFSRFSLPDPPRLHPFLGMVTHEITASDGIYDILLENWLVKDQGVMLIW